MILNTNFKVCCGIYIMFLFSNSIYSQNTNVCEIRYDKGIYIFLTADSGISPVEKEYKIAKIEKYLLELNSAVKNKKIILSRYFNGEYITNRDYILIDTLKLVMISYSTHYFNIGINYKNPSGSFSSTINEKDKLYEYNCYTRMQSIKKTTDEGVNSEIEEKEFRDKKDQRDSRIVEPILNSSQDAEFLMKIMLYNRLKSIYGKKSHIKKANKKSIKQKADKNPPSLPGILQKAKPTIIKN